MKKKIFGIIAFAAIAAVSGWNYTLNMNNVNLSDLALENVEALAQGEQFNETFICLGSGNVECNGSFVQYKISGYHLK